MQQYFQLSTRERQELLQLATGTDTLYSEAVLTIDAAVDTKLTVQSTAAEHRLITGGTADQEAAD